MGLLDAGAFVNHTDQLGQTPLFNAKTVAVARLLLEAKADLHMRDRFEHSIVHAASSGEVVHFLVSRNASVESRNMWGEVPLHHAARGGHLQVVVRLLALKARPDVVDHKNQTPLHLAADQNTACSLVEAGIPREAIVGSIHAARSRARDLGLSDHEKEQADNIASWLQSLVHAADGRGCDIRKILEKNQKGQRNSTIQRSESTPDLREKRKTLLSASKADLPSRRSSIKGHLFEKAVGARIEARAQALFDDQNRNRVYVPF